MKSIPFGMGEIRLRRMKYFALRNVKYFASQNVKEAFCYAKSIPIENGTAHSPASFRSRGALFRAATSESRRFSAEKRRLMFAPN